MVTLDYFASRPGDTSVGSDGAQGAVAEGIPESEAPFRFAWSPAAGTLVPYVKFGIRV